MDISRLVELAKDHAVSGLGDPREIARVNRIADSIRSEVKAGLESAAQRDMLLEMLDQQYLGGWIAFIGMEIHALAPAQAERCLDRIKKIANGTTIDSVGARTWLSRHGADV